MLPERLAAALEQIDNMKAPSLESVLRVRGLRFEANRIRELMEAYEEWKKGTQQ